MSDDGPEPLSIGELSRRTGLPVRTIRYWSDLGLLPPAGRAPGGHRRFAVESVARLELVRTLRELGIGLADVRRLLARETSLEAVAAVHLAALDARIRSLRLSRAVLSAVVRRRFGTEEMTMVNRLARQSAQERRRIIEEFHREVFGGLDADPHLSERLRHVPADLPDDPAPAQVEAWVELAELVQDPDFRRRMRDMFEQHAGGRADGGQAAGPGAHRWFAAKLTRLAGEARERGVAPGSPEAGELLDRLLGDADRAAVLRRLRAGSFADADRYRRLVATIRGKEPEAPHAADFDWLIAALTARLP
ncbi:MerR family transcriptional regulator [Streptomyces hoynatensis]|uniref:MerR family transcriptional regulator n=1 Tax=Streptomyces hoynatensis TaxID=1141874 RepID=A0A3A9YJ86_9ACTN|nr:MerR family transcriptional regulator [Streptomyces hoynatensis]RKN36888.1 MerR family transcriptional regulator [Streptomyces hoynatensis]